jgi:hypothetical protein
MKPTKNRVFCKDCERTKMLFETEKKAENFIKFNYEEIEATSGYRPQRSYYCLFCDGWHTTSMKEQIGLSKKEQLFEILQEKDKKPLNNHEETKNKKLSEIEDQIKDFDIFNKEQFFSDNIDILSKEIESLNSDNDKERIKNLRQNRDFFYILRKKYGLKKNKFEEARNKEIDNWCKWLEKIGY